MMDDNPFADPAVAGVTSGQEGGGIDDYNPFDSRAGAPPPGKPTATISPNTEPVSGELAAVQEDLERRRKDLDRRARELDDRERALHGQNNPRENNWPPLPTWCGIGPCFYQDISVDIPPDFQRIVRHMYYIWLSHAALYVVNMIVMMALMFQAGYGKGFGLALFYMFLFIPLSYVTWFRTVYKAFRSDSSFNFLLFFFIFFFQLCVAVIQAIGIPDLGTCGFIVGLEVITNPARTAGYIVVGAMTLLVAVGFGVVAFLDFLMLVKVHRIYRSSDASFAKAQAEFTSGVLRNETVRNAAQDIAVQSARNNLPDYPGGRY